MSHLARAENPVTGADVVAQTHAGIEALALQGRRATRVLLTPRAAALVAIWLSSGGLAMDDGESIFGVPGSQLLGLDVIMLDSSDDRPLVLP